MSWRRAGMIGAAVLCFFAGPQLALAHDRPGDRDGGPIRFTGVVTAVRAGVVQVQTRTGPMDAALSSATNVIRRITCTTADLRVGAYVSLHLARGTTTVMSATVNATGNRNPMAEPYPEFHDYRWSQAPADSKQRHLLTQGQITAVRRNQLTIRGSHGRTATYSVASGIRVLKLMTGRVGDLGTGETVAVERGPGGYALTIVILSA